MKYDIYESWRDGSCERKISKTELRRIFGVETDAVYKRMTSGDEEIIEKDNYHYWSEEAMVYSKGY